MGKGARHRLRHGAPRSHASGVIRKMRDGVWGELLLARRGDPKGTKFHDHGHK
jgi:hypothetical protein